MDKIFNSGTLRLAFDFAIGALLLVLALVFIGNAFDFAITVLCTILIVVGTSLFIRQDYEVIKAYREERA